MYNIINNYVLYTTTIMSREEMGAEIFKEILKNKNTRNSVNSYFRESVEYSSLIDDIPENDVCFPRSTAPVAPTKTKTQPHTNVVLSDGIEKANFIMRDNGLFNKAGVHLGTYREWNDSVYEIPECYKDDFNYVVYNGKRLYEFQLFATSRPYHDLEMDTGSGAVSIFRTHKYDYGLDKLIHNHTDKWASITSLSSISQISCSTT